MASPMTGTVARHSPSMRWALLALVLVAVYCVYDPYYSVRRRAPRHGVDPARLQRALDDDPEIEILRTSTDSDRTYYSCARGGMSVGVAISEEFVSVSVGDTHRPNEADAVRWREDADYICGRLRAACPELGAWKSSEYLSLSDLEMPSLGHFAGFGLAAACAWGLFRLLWRKRKPSPDQGAKP
jgi:hypothetical protein